MREKQETVSLPDEIRDYFWDYDPNRLSGEEGRHTIVRRLLESGGMQAVRWLRKHLSNEEIRDFIIQRRGRGLSSRRLRFWSLIVGISRKDVDEWLEASRQNPWHKRTS